MSSSVLQNFEQIAQTYEQKLHAALDKVADLAKINSDQKDVIDIHLKLIEKYENDIEQMKKEFKPNEMSGKPFVESKSTSSLKKENEALKTQIRQLKKGHAELAKKLENAREIKTDSEVHTIPESNLMARLNNL